MRFTKMQGAGNDFVVADNMDNIDRNTLGAVGLTVVQVLFSEQP